MESWTLDSQQRICADTHRNVHFKHVGKIRLTLSYRQFLNLNDIVLDLSTFYRMKFYPLGDSVWLQFHKHNIQLYQCERNIYFTFHTASWRKYIKSVHPQLRSFLRHGRSPLHDRQHAPSHETIYQNRSGGIASANLKQQVVSREAKDVSGENEQWAEHSNLSEWDSANTGRPFSFIGAVDALRTSDNAPPDMEEGEVCDDTIDCGQFSDLYTIE